MGDAKFRRPAPAPAAEFSEEFACLLQQDQAL